MLRHGVDGRVLGDRIGTSHDYLGLVSILLDDQFFLCQDVRRFDFEERRRHTHQSWCILDLLRVARCACAAINLRWDISFRDGLLGMHNALRLRD
jgi:hypothetical protein